MVNNWESWKILVAEQRIVNQAISQADIEQFKKEKEAKDKAKKELEEKSEKDREARAIEDTRLAQKRAMFKGG